jgi:hypothetical protein
VIQFWTKNQEKEQQTNINKNNISRKASWTTAASQSSSISGLPAQTNYPSL